MVTLRLYEHSPGSTGKGDSMKLRHSTAVALALELHAASEKAWEEAFHQVKIAAVARAMMKSSATINCCAVNWAKETQLLSDNALKKAHTAAENSRIAWIEALK